jgi:hypothetical protein
MSALRRHIIFSVLALSFSLPVWAATTEVEHFDKQLAAHGVSAEYSDAGMTALIELIRSDVAALKAQAAAAGSDDRAKLEEMAEAVSGALDQFAKIAASEDKAAKSAAFPAAKSMLYSLRAELQGKRKINAMFVVFGILGNLSLKIPYLTPEERSRPLTLDEAKLEAANLEDPATGKLYRDPAELAGLSSEQVSRLDVRSDNYLWYTDSELHRLKAQHKTAWKAMEVRMEERATAALQTPYSLDRARRVLVFEKIRKVASSPKIDTRDLYGQAWKVKWGEEVQTEALANRLYAELGGKFDDLVYANQGPRDLVLVLNKRGRDDAGSHCGEIATLDQLERCLLRSTYKFDITAHVTGHGTLTEEMLHEEPFASLPADRKALLGREFVTFNESLVEIEPEAAEFQGLGAGPLSSAGALDDRVKRGLAILSYWIQNKDVKDDNNRGVIDRRSGAYFEYMHDMGASLGSLKLSGSPNRLKMGDAFVRRRGSKVKFTADMLFVPKAFDRATYADAVWMVRKIVELRKEDILAAVAATRWPDFQQEVMASRLIARRNDMARAFDFGAPLHYEVAPKVVPLSTPADRHAAVVRYGLSIATAGDDGKAVTLLEQFMGECGIPIDAHGQANFEDRVDRQVVPQKGKNEEVVLATEDCEKSVIVTLLERTIHPAGLARRIWRRVDDKPLKQCRPTPKTLGLRSARLVRD